MAAKEGVTIKNTLITEVYDFEQFSEAYPDAIVLFLADAKGLRPAKAKLGKIAAGTTVFAMVTEPTPSS